MDEQVDGIAHIQDLVAVDIAIEERSEGVISTRVGYRVELLPEATGEQDGYDEQQGYSELPHADTFQLKLD